MKTFDTFAATSLLGLLLVTGCSQSRSRAIAPEGEPKDYRKMVERVRERKENRNRMYMLQDGINRFQVELGRTPTNLYEMVRFRYIEGIPQPPKGMTYAYDADRGTVRIVRQQAPAGIHIAEDAPTGSVKLKDDDTEKSVPTGLR